MRPGRIDLSIKFKKLRRNDIQSLYKQWFNISIKNDTLNKIKDYSISQAEFGKLCLENEKQPSRVIDSLLKL